MAFVSKANKPSEKKFFGSPREFITANNNYLGLKDALQKFSSIPTYTKHRYFRKHHPTARVIVGGINQLHQADLIDVSNLSIYNNGVKFLLIVEDVFSKFIWVQPLLNKANVSILQAFQKIYTDVSKFPSSLSTDKGTEFIGQLVKKFFAQHNVQYFTSEGNTKAQFVERTIRTFKKILYGLMDLNKTFSFIGFLQVAVQMYNSKVSSVTKFAPKEVSSANARQVFFNTYGPTLKDIVHLRIPPAHQSKLFDVGDFVRIAVNKGVFSKKYQNTFSAELFKIVEVVPNNPMQYKLADIQDEPIVGKFYPSELQKVDIRTEKMWVEKILEEKTINQNKMALVKWQNYGNKFTSWVFFSELIPFEAPGETWQS